MRCARARRRLSAYQDGALGEPEQKAIRAHLADCPDCAALAAELQRACELLDLSEAVDTSPGFVTGVMRRVQATFPRPVWQAPRWAVAAGLAVCLVCGGTAGLVHSGDSGATRASQAELAVDVSQRLGLEAFAPSPTDTVAGAYVQFTGGTSGR